MEPILTLFPFFSLLFFSLCTPNSLQSNKRARRNKAGDPPRRAEQRKRERKSDWSCEFDHCSLARFLARSLAFSKTPRPPPTFFSSLSLSPFPRSSTSCASSRTATRGRRTSSLRRLPRPLLLLPIISLRRRRAAARTPPPRSSAGRRRRLRRQPASRRSPRRLSRPPQLPRLSRLLQLRRLPARPGGGSNSEAEVQ